MKRQDILTIGTLAEKSGVGVETVRFYERKGLIRQPTVKGSGYRQYSSDDAQKIRFIKRAQDLGFTLKEIQELLELNVSSKATCIDIKAKTDLKLAEVQAKIKDLQRMSRSLKRLSAACGDSEQAASQCRILNCFESGWTC